jgi:hypothetical protein
MAVTARDHAYFFAAGLAFGAAFFTGFAAGFFAPAFFFALVAAALPEAIGFLQQVTTFAAAHPQASSTTNTNPHTSQLNKSPFFAFAIDASSFVCFKVDSA